MEPSAAWPRAPSSPTPPRWGEREITPPALAPSQPASALPLPPLQVDRNPPAYASGITWWGTPYDARFDFSVNDQTDSKCAGANCDAFYFLNLLDVDGSLTGGRDLPLETFVLNAGGNVTAYESRLGRVYPITPGSTVLGPNPLLAYGEDVCPSQSAWNAAVESRVWPCLANDTAMVSIGIRLAAARLAMGP
jgi:hypothetical protein